MVDSLGSVTYYMLLSSRVHQSVMIQCMDMRYAVHNNEFSGSKIVSECYTHNTYVYTYIHTS